MFFYLCKGLFSGFLEFKGNFVDGQNYSKYFDWATLCCVHTLRWSFISLQKSFECFWIINMQCIFCLRFINMLSGNRRAEIFTFILLLWKCGPFFQIATCELFSCFLITSLVFIFSRCSFHGWRHTVSMSCRFQSIHFVRKTFSKTQIQ